MENEGDFFEKRKPRSFTHASRFVLSVDGQRKSSHEAQPEAVAAGAKIAAAYPRVSVSVHDQQQGTRTNISANPAPQQQSQASTSAREGEDEGI